MIFLGLGEKAAREQEEAYKKIMYPEVPRFPRASIAVGKMASWFFNWSVYIALPLGPLKKPLLALSRRRGKVEWAQKSWVERMMAFSIVGVVGLFFPLLMGLSGGPRTVRPPVFK